MHDHPSLLPDEARQVIDERIRAAAATRTARAAKGSIRSRRRHRLDRQLGSVSDRLDV